MGPRRAALRPLDQDYVRAQISEDLARKEAAALGQIQNSDAG